MAIDLGQTNLTPACAAGPSLKGWQWSSVPGSYWPAAVRSVQYAPVSPYSVRWQALVIGIYGAGSHLIPGYYGSMPDGTGLIDGNAAYGCPVNQISGSTPTQPITYWEYPTNSDPGPIPLITTLAIEGWPNSGSNNQDNRINGVIAVTSGSPTVTGSGSNFTSWLLAGDQVCFGHSQQSPSQMPRPDILYTIASIASDTSLTLTTNYGQTSHIFADGWEIFGPYFRLPTYAQTQAFGGDSRCPIIVRNESTGLPSKLWEMWYLSYDPGTGYQAGAGALYDLSTGAQRPDGFTSTSAAGMPCSPFLLRYEEALAGTIATPMRGEVLPGLCLSNQCIWPATHAASAGMTDFTTGLLPIGAVMRLNAGWVASNKSSFPPIIQNMLTALSIYGMIVHDYGSAGGPVTIDVCPDARWNKADLLTIQNIPASALEIVDSIKPQYTLSISPGPYTSGTAITFTVTYVGDEGLYGLSGGQSTNTNFGLTDGAIRIYVAYSTDAGVTYTPGPFVDIASSSRSGTTTFTPGTGNYLFKTELSEVYWLPPPVISAAVSVSARSLTTSQDGRWDDPATWGGLAPPAAGDTATLAHNVTMVGDAIIGDGTASTVLTCTAGTLTVIGCTLTIRGNATFGVYNSGNTVNRLTVWSSAGNAAGLLLDGNSGVTPIVSADNDTQFTFTGTSSAHVTVRTKSGTAGNPGYFNSIGSLRGLYTIAAYTDFSFLGTSSQAGFNAGNLDDVTTPANPPFTMDHCTVDNCGFFPTASISGGSVNFSLTNSIWTNALQISGDTVTISATNIATANPLTTGIRLIDKCVFTARLYTGSMGGFTFTNSYFGDGIMVSTGIPAGIYSTFDGNFIARIGSSVSELGIMSVSNSYCYMEQPTGSFELIESVGSFNVVNNVCEYNGPGSPGDPLVWFGNSEENVYGPVTQTVANNIVFNSGSGAYDKFYNINSNPLPDAGNPRFLQTTNMLHNTIVGARDSPVQGAFGTNMPALAFAECRANIFFTADPGTWYIFKNTSAIIITDQMPASAAKTNCWKGYSLQPPNTWTVTTPVAGATTCNDGTPYFSPMSGTTAPGAGDLVNVDPEFADTTRNLATWDHIVMGGPGTAAHAMQLLQATPTLTKTSLLPWVRAGYAPTNAALLTSAYDGTTIGAVQPSGGLVATSLKDTTRATMMTAIVTAITSTSRIKIYSGSAPAKTATPTGTLLSTLTPSATFGTVSGGVLTANAITSDSSAAASGTPGYYRVIDGTTDDGTHTQIQGSAGVGSGDINFGSTISSGGTVAISSLTYTQGDP